MWETILNVTVKKKKGKIGDVLGYMTHIHKGNVSTTEAIRWTVY